MNSLKKKKMERPEPPAAAKPAPQQVNIVCAPGCPGCLANNELLNTVERARAAGGL